MVIIVVGSITKAAEMELGGRELVNMHHAFRNSVLGAFSNTVKSLIQQTFNQVL